MKVIVETSARHVHVTKEVFEVLFGKGVELTKKKDLSQPGQFASNERVTVKGPKKDQPNVSILGPFIPFFLIWIWLLACKTVRPLAFSPSSLLAFWFEMV